MNFLEKQMKILFGESELFYDAMFCGKMMIGKIDNDVRVKLEFVSTEIKNHYNAIRATVINRTDGVIDTATFHMKDIIGTKCGNDTYIWDNDERQAWYGFNITGSEQEQISDKIHDYMSMFANEDLNYQMRTF